jgi:hypothetical protein
MVDPSKLLFSLPTICDELPPVTAEPAHKGDVLLHEDDWRQLELVASPQRHMISENLAAIREVRAEASGLGFARIHVREEPRRPLFGLDLDRDQLVSVIPTEHGPVAVAFASELRRISGAFAYVGPTSTVYAVEHEGVIVTLGVHITSASDSRDAGVAALTELADQHGAYLVDWVGAHSHPDVRKQ